MKAYRYRDGRNGRVDAAVVRREFEKIKRRGALTPRAIVDEAAKEDSPLHPLFPWDNDHAADLYRLDLARSLVVDVVVVESGELGEAVERVAYVSVVQQDGSRAYVDTVEALSNEEVEAQLTREFIAALEGLRSRYGMLKTLVKEMQMIDKIIQKHMETV